MQLRIILPTKDCIINTDSREQLLFKFRKLQLNMRHSRINRVLRVTLKFHQWDRIQWWQNRSHKEMKMIAQLDFTLLIHSMLFWDISRILAQTYLEWGLLFRRRSIIHDYWRSSRCDKTHFWWLFCFHASNFECLSTWKVTSEKERLK